MKSAILQVSTEQVCTALGLPTGTEIIGARFSPFQGTLLEFVITHPALEDQPEGIRPPYVVLDEGMYRR